MITAADILKLVVRTMKHFVALAEQLLKEKK